MAVHTLALDWNEQIAFLNLAAIRYRTGDHFFQIRCLADIGTVTRLGDVFQSHIRHTVFQFILIITSKHP